MSTNMALDRRDDLGGSDVEVSGQLIAALPSAVEETCGSFEQAMERYMTESSLETVDYDSWYDRSELLAMCTHLRDRVGEQIIERLGRFVPALLDWPSDVTTVAAALAHLEDWYDGLHRGHDDSIEYRMVDDHHAQLTFDTPYPAPFERGLVRGIGHQFESSSVLGLVVDSETTADGLSRVVVL